MCVCVCVYMLLLYFKHNRMSSPKKMYDISLKGLVQNTAADAESKCCLPTYIQTQHTHTYKKIYIYIYTHSMDP